MNKNKSHPNASWLSRFTQKFHREPHSRDDLVTVLQEAHGKDLIDAEALHMIEGVLRVSRTQVRDIMVPRAQMVVIEHDATLHDILPVITESAHSRFPVIGESRDEILGLLLAKDLLPYAVSPTETAFALSHLIRPIVFIPESKRLNVLLKEFRAKRNHMAIVVDEYGGIAGLVTIEDVLEQIVGDIEDETDKHDDENSIRPLEKDEYAVKALTPIDEFNQFFDTNISDEDFDTIGGYITQQFGHMPKRGERVTLNGFTFTILLGSQRRLELLCVKKHVHE